MLHIKINDKKIKGENVHNDKLRRDLMKKGFNTFVKLIIDCLFLGGTYLIMKLTFYLVTNINLIL